MSTIKRIELINAINEYVLDNKTEPVVDILNRLLDNEVIKKDRVLIDFYAEWCNPCKMLGMILEDVDKIEVVKLDVDRFGSIAKEYKVMSIPAIKIFSNGKVEKESVGFMSREELNNFIKE